MLAFQYAGTYPEHINKLVLMSCMGINSDYFEFYKKNKEKNK
jgi:pimeloyl-ACP methyl ester carboxylesterase